MLRYAVSLSALRAKVAPAAPAIINRNLVSSVLLSSTRDAYENKRIADLKNELKSRGLVFSGKKDDLIKRLVDNDSLRAGSNLKQPETRTRSKSTLASLRTEDPKETSKTEASPVSSEGQKAAEATAKAVSEAANPLGSLKKEETPANLEAGSVHSAAADGLENPETAKASPTPAPEDPAIKTSPPGLPSQKAPQPKETFNLRIPYYEDLPAEETYVPVVTSYTSPHITSKKSEESTSSGPKVMSVSSTSTFSGQGVSHNAELEGQEDDSSASNKGFFSEILAEIQGPSESKDGATSKAFGSIAAQAKGFLDQATESLGSAAKSSSSSGSSSSSSSLRSANRPLNDEERNGTWVLLGIIAGGFALGGLGKSKSAKHEGSHDDKDAKASTKPGAVKLTPPKTMAQPTGSSVATPAGSSVKAPIMCVPKGSIVASTMAASTGLTDSTLAQIARLSTCEVSDALLKLKLPHGGHLPGIEIFSPAHLDGETKICGPAFTVKMVSQTDKYAPKPDKHFVDAAEPDSVVVVAAPANTRSAIWGGLMTARAQFIGVKGVILDGRCRDIGEHREAKFPVFARGHSTLGQSPFTRPSELQVPITILDPTIASAKEDKAGGPKFPSLTVNPGDIVLADVDGVVVIPPFLANKVVELANKGKSEDEKCIQELKLGKGVKETFVLHRSQ